MAGLQLCATRFISLLSINFILVSSGLANKPVQNVPEPLIQSALNSLNEDSPTHHTYKGGNLISAQKLEETPYVTYRLTFDLTAVCKESLEPCPREACTVEVKQHERGFINVLRESIQCMYLYPQSAQDDPLQIQENTQEQEIIENFDKQFITNQTVELDHEIQNTGDHNEKPFIAVRASSPTYCPGCPYELNPNLPSASMFGDEVARSMDEFVQNDFKHKAVDIVQLSRAVSPTSNVIKYQVLVRIGESDCLKNAIDESQCSVQENLPIKTCLVTFEQRWQQPTRVITRNNCTVDNNSYSTLNSEALVTPAPNREANMEKTEALESLKGILDNYTYATPVKSEGQEQPEVTERPIVRVLLDRNDDAENHRGFEDKAREFGEFLKDFDLPVREDKSNPEIQREEVTEDIILPRRVSSANNESPMLNRNKRSRDSIGVRGAPSRKDVNDPKVRELAMKGLQRLSENYEGTNEPIIVEIVEASRQVVSGTLDKIKVKVGSSTCPKGTKDGCLLQAESEIQECLFTLWSQPWLDDGSPKITIDCDLKSDSNINMRDARSAPEINGEVQGSGKSLSAEAAANESRNLRRNRRRSNVVGAPSTKSINDPEIQDLANKGLQRLSENYEGTNEPIIVEIVEASRQVVSGTLDKIKVKVGSSTCPKGTKDGCQLQAESEIQECLFTLWSQPWLDDESPKITIDCDLKSDSNINMRNARSAPERNGEVQGSGKSLPAEAVANESRNLRRNRRRSNLVGAPSTKSINDPEIQDLANKGLQKFSENLEGTYEPIITEIVEASQQVVSGYLYKIKVNLGTSTCAKGVKSNCQLKEGSEIQQCLFTIWSQPWNDKGSPEITINCDVSNPVKRSLRGAQYSQKMMKLADDIKAENLFENFLKEHDKIYPSLEEKEKRLAIFKENLGTIGDLQKFERGTAEYGVTMFADLTREEFKARHLGFRSDLRQENEIPLAVAEIPDVDLPPEFDWRHHNAVTPVKNQGQCGSCWAFSVTGNVEGQYAIKHEKLLSLSEQELVDCDTMDQGCGGGEMENAYRMIEKMGGLELENDYPYDAKNEACHFAKDKAKVQVVSAVNITSNETGMAQWLVKNGPISIAINANAMQFYMGGVSHPFRFLCTPGDLDHGVLIVGYGTKHDRLFHRELPYWIIKNSWGPKWGEQGYYRAYRGDGTCGLNAQPSSAVVA